jgi:hypothetical protein
MRIALYGWLAVAAGFAIGMAGALEGQTYTYSTFTVPDAAPATEGSLAVNAINKAGDIVGLLIDTSGNTKGWVRNTSGTIAELVDPLDTNSPTYTTVYGINNYGTIVGLFYDTAQSYYPGLLYSSTKKKYATFNLSGEPTGTATYVLALNDITNDYCGGVGAPPNFQYQAFLSLNGTNTFPAFTGATDSYCYGLNDLDDAVGYYTDSTGVAHGWYRNPKTGAISIINVPGASTTTVSATCYGTVGGTVVEGINNSGAISGHYFDASGLSHGFVLADKKFTILNVPGAYQTGGGGINALGQVVGHYSDSSCNNSGYIATPAQ